VANYLFNFSKKGAAKGKTLREQAAELLDVRLWGIGAKTPNRKSLAPGDRVLIYVGAPEREFVGHARLSSATHVWTQEEQARYPGDWDSGVAFDDAEVWAHPVPMKSVLPHLDLRETNPNAHFFAGVARIKQHDYETVVGAANGKLPSPVSASAPASIAEPKTGPEPSSDIDLLFATVAQLKKAATLGGSFSEYDTRAYFIDKYLAALGYTELGDIQHGSPVDSGTFPDYVLVVNGKPAIAIEAKKLGATLGPKEAAQVVAYCSNLGVRWGALTDGRFWKLYDAPVLGVPPSERLVQSVDLSDYKDREDFEARIYPELELIAKDELASGAGLERRVAQEAVRELLTTTGSKTLKALRRELDEVKAIKLTPADLAELVSELLG
jgi:predicted type IV restriction endonuclease